MFHSLTVSRLSPLAEGAVAVSLAVPPRLRPAFRHVPGQHLTVRHRHEGRELRRTYSVCSPAPGAGGPAELTIGVRHVRGGAFSTHALRELAVGDRLEVLPPAGRFTLPPAPGRFAALTGGSGITPVLSMAATLLAREPAARFTLLRSDRTASSAMFLDETADLKDRYPERFQQVHALTREERHTGLAAGRLDARRLRGLLPALLPVGEVDGWYLCGPRGLVEAGNAALRALGVPRARVHSELFHAEDAPPAPPGDAGEAVARGGTLAVTLGGRRAELALAPGETLLGTVLRNRPDAPYACRGGVCGTCRARLLAGRVAMARNYALEPAEVTAGYVLPCQSRPLTDHVELDFDA
ncbi:2Fe-2S iron-sulfur cluster-binding protein [Streptomyces hoynatensis]|uniref:Phenylacetic acid degradation protein n=1 Tax=Streptomyces hoynatensis TaxID=1141874 RepID=A0A3A9Z7G7_9ACTN|nr:2Fe-2S iron-sulfur cluster-binding protein [Streptomyces hoynatensis]RKN43166.1 phenylacetic acid degradation protein [Streptomyces hoynatensis]